MVYKTKKHFMVYKKIKLIYFQSTHNVNMYFLKYVLLTLLVSKSAQGRFKSQVVSLYTYITIILL